MRGFNGIMIAVLVGGFIAAWLNIGLDVTSPIIFWMLGTVTGVAAFGMAMYE